VHVTEQITQSIRQGTYSVGDRLPPERVIAEQMGVSRPSVREAFSALQLVGVLESRPGDGTYVVKTPDTRDAAISLLEREESPLEALDARRVLERAIVEVAAARTTSQGLDGIERALEALRMAAEARDYEAYTQANGPFHLAIVRATGNELLERAVRPLIEVMQHQLAQELRRRAYVPGGASFDTGFAVHAEIYHALMDRDPTRAVRAMDRHFGLIEDSLRS
jgi:GntR family transcriptional repressor for pyruvate dehydrogenase complex